jgi:hypothetical protein
VINRLKASDFIPVTFHRIQISAIVVKVELSLRNERVSVYPPLTLKIHLAGLAEILDSLRLAYFFLKKKLNFCFTAGRAL